MSLLSLFKSINFCISFFCIMPLRSYVHSLTRAQNNNRHQAEPKFSVFLGQESGLGVVSLHAGHQRSHQTARCCQQQLPAASTDRPRIVMWRSQNHSGDRLMLQPLLIDMRRGGEDAFTAIQSTDILALMPKCYDIGLHAARCCQQQLRFYQ